MSWGEFEHAAPELATEGRRLLHRDGIGQGLLATVRDDDVPRTTRSGSRSWTAGSTRSSPVGQRVDLERDGRFALHNHVDPEAPSEFSIRGRARPVDDAAVRSAVAADWAFEADEAYRLFELEVDAAVLGRAAARTTGRRSTPRGPPAGPRRPEAGRPRLT